MRPQAPMDMASDMDSHRDVTPLASGADGICNQDDPSYALPFIGIIFDFSISHLQYGIFDFKYFSIILYISD